MTIQSERAFSILLPYYSRRPPSAQTGPICSASECVQSARWWPSSSLVRKAIKTHTHTAKDIIGRPRISKGRETVATKRNEINAQGETISNSVCRLWEEPREKEKKRQRNMCHHQRRRKTCTTRSRSSSSWMGLIFSQEVAGNVGDGVEFIQYIQRKKEKAAWIISDIYIYIWKFLANITSGI